MADVHRSSFSVHRCKLTGVDISADFLAVSRRSALSIEWVHRDIRGLPWRDRYDDALMFGNSFGYFDRRDTRKFLTGHARSLRSEAPFVLETAMTAESLLPALQIERHMVVGDITFHSKTSYDSRNSRLDVE